METLQYKFKPKTTVYYVARTLFTEDNPLSYSAYEGWIAEVRITIDSNYVVRIKYYVISLIRGESRLLMEDDLDLCETLKEAQERAGFLNQLEEIDRKYKDLIR